MPRHMLGILGRKAGMTQIFKDGKRFGVTVIEAGPCRVLQVKTKTTDELPEEQALPPRKHSHTGQEEARRPRKPDGYYALQLGFDPKPRKRTTKPELGHALKATPDDVKGDKKANVGFRFIREFRLDAKPEKNPGELIDLNILEGEVFVDVTGTSKGKGFAGVMKRWNFSGQRASHGAEKVHRHAGGIGRTYSINKGVPKGKKMAGHMGVEKVTTKGLRVVDVDKENHVLLVEGTVPGPKGGYLVIRASDRVKNTRAKRK